MIIGLCGLAGSGKDTSANFIMEYDNSYQRLSFADAVKDIVALAFGWDRNLLQGGTQESREWREKEDLFWGVSPRKAMQLIATDCFRNIIRDDFWVKSIEKKIKDNPTQNYVITDVRFPNEVKMIHQNGGEVWQIKREEEKPVWWDLAEKANGYNCSDESEQQTCIELMKDIYRDIHISEWALVGNKDIKIENIVINNFGALKDLRSIIFEEMKMLEGLNG